MVIASVALVAPLHAEVKQSAPDGMLVAHELLVKAKPEVVYAALSQVGKWWAPAHTWSGKPANLSLDARAGGCFCEAWDGSTVEHGRVVMARSGQLLRLHASLGPLQEMALFGALTWTVTAEGSETKLSVTYRVSGDSMHGLDKFAPVVDGVIGEQAGRLKTFVETGAP
jgi:uncharacterized protein YndB with AHSA1/START domain